MNLRLSARPLLLLLLLQPVRLAAAPLPLDPALRDREWLLEALLYSYYWYLDDAYFAATADNPETEVWLRSTEPPARDAGDRSRFAELWLPSARVRLTLKQADYYVPELNLAVQSRGYRVLRGSYESEPPEDPGAWTVLVLSREEVSRSLHSARHQAHVPGPETKAVVLAALQREMQRAGDVRGPQRFHLAARTGVATDVWVFWEDRRALLQISGDLDLTTPGVAAHLPLLVRPYNLGANVVASLLETRGSNAVITRDRASRVLFLCLARGESLTLAPP